MAQDYDSSITSVNVIGLIALICCCLGSWIAFGVLCCCTVEYIALLVVQMLAERSK